MDYIEKETGSKKAKELEQYHWLDRAMLNHAQLEKRHKAMKHNE